MRKWISSRAVGTAAVLVASLHLPLVAQAVGPDGQPAALPSDTTGLKTLTVDDYGEWNRVTSTSLSADGRWVTYAYQPAEGTGTFHIQELDGELLYVVAGGSTSAGRGGGGPSFTADARWAGYFVTPAADSGRSGARGARRSGSSGTRFELLELGTGEKTTIPGAAGFSFSADSKWLAVRMAGTLSDTAANGADVLIRELASGTTRNLGNVAEYAFNETGGMLAYTVDAGGNLGNGVYVLDLSNSQTRVLATGVAEFDQLAWNDRGTNLLAYRGAQSEERQQRDNVLLAWTDVGTSKQQLIEYDPAQDERFPQGMVLSEFSAPSWSGDGSRIFVGLKEQTDVEKDNEEPKADVDVWHWRDADLQSEQIVRLPRQRRATHPGVFLLERGTVVQLGDALLEIVERTTDGRWAVGKIDTAYEHAVTWLEPYADYYRINGETGERTLIDTNLLRTMGISDDGRWFLYLKDQQIHAHGLDSGRTTVLDAGMNFINTADDFTYEKGIWGVAGWSKDGRSVLLYDQFDIWQMPLDGGAPENLTAGVGSAQQIAFCIVRDGRGGRVAGGGGIPSSRCRSGGGDDDDGGIDPSRPLLLSGYGEWTKKTGYWTLDAGGKPETLIWADGNVRVATRAEEADRILFVQETFNEFPDYWVSDTSFRSPRRVTNANPQIDRYAWSSGKVLIDYENSRGQRLQGTLTLPAGYVPGRTYPMLVIFYQLMSDQHHAFSMPTFNHRPQPSTYASNGYLVFQPDIVYEEGRPGTSALDCMTAAVQKVIDLGYADPERIGLHGHSWSGYQSAFFVTQTDMFAAVVMGAAPTNLISFYNELYKTTGAVQHGITELSQVRMGKNVTPWNAHDLYESQSPIYHVTKIRTPFMMMHGTADGAVDYIEGIQFYNAARRNGKEVILLSYPGEGHSLGRKENQIDFQTRMKQFYDHHLKGEPAPEWLRDGVPQLQKGGPIE